MVAIFLKAKLFGFLTDNWGICGDVLWARTEGVSIEVMLNKVRKEITFTPWKRPGVFIRNDDKKLYVLAGVISATLDEVKNLGQLYEMPEDRQKELGLV
jgi:hypothetical protein